ncbi:Succinate-semialdehyde dehydrogenase, mitochondrial [Perkinsus chesapeaki]|uniref:Succinate-semialdehyde dehydrogenase, mitochondrial n=1 Tax=Perkinsus chesapeaki TaxID=330153 RepID=A0A7J6LTX1_PERCH|nr:Succinate-semialdehyde dehydrogenase, mitochondrial [Perkinsus chesapeaki]
MLSSPARRFVPVTAGAMARFSRTFTSTVAGSLDFINFDPNKKDCEPVNLHNFLNGQWVSAAKTTEIVDPLTGKPMLRMPDTSTSELDPFVKSMQAVPKSGLHNPLRNVERYRMYGDISHRLAAELRKKEVLEHFAKCIQRVAPKSWAQSVAEVDIVRIFLENFSGDQVRFLARGFMVSGDRDGQQSQGYRWPYGPTALIAPFNFPLEIPVLQLMGALYMGNHVTLKCASMTSMVGAPPNDVNMIHCGGKVAEALLVEGKPRLTLFTGSSGVAERLAKVTAGRIKIEDAGFDWKILGPVRNLASQLEHIAWTCDQDAYAHTGQKCSAQSILFAHSDWVNAGIFDKMGQIAGERSLSNLTIGPVLSHTTADIQGHQEKLLKIPGAKVLFGGKPLTGHTIPECYGAYEPTAVFVPLEELIKPENFGTCTREIFGPFQVCTEWKDDQLQLVLDATERMSAHLTAAVISDDPQVKNAVLGVTVNGTTYAGVRARTTGAPQNHWFGPAGDPRAAGIGTPEAIKLVWSCHREIIHDDGPVPEGWTRPTPA